MTLKDTISILSEYDVNLGLVREYFATTLTESINQINEQHENVKSLEISLDETDLAINLIEREGVQYECRNCQICNSALDLPSVHFMCRHSFHKGCLEAYSEDRKCVLCSDEHKKVTNRAKSLLQFLER
ncbi:hypothetical protein ACOME3_004458 [Neoechinorhynchus agilis]